MDASAANKNTHFASKTGHGSLQQVGRVFWRVLNGVSYPVELFHSNGTRPVETIGDSYWVYAAIQQSFTLFQQSTSKDFTTSSNNQQDDYG